jgi:multiple sugar transport system permease protein
LTNRSAEISLPRARSGSGRAWRLSYRKQAYLFLVPYLLGTLVLVALPALATVAIAFTDYYAVQPPAWAGLENFRRLMTSPLVRTSLYNSLVFLALAVPLRVGGALLLALLLRRPRRLSGLYRTAVYLPTVIPEAAYALVWLWIFNPLYGPLNAILQALGLPAPAWLAEPATARLAIVIMAAFQLAEGFVILLAGLQTIPRALYDLATVDGAGAWQSFRHVTLPLILPWLLLLTFRDLIVSLQNTFAPSFIMTYGGPYYATTFVPLLVYEIAFDFTDLGLASALLLLTYAILGLVVVGILSLVGGLRRQE